MRAIRRVIIHCSATPEGRHHTADDIRRWHVEGNKWADIGYHYVIQLDGTIEAGRPEDQIGAHTRGQNSDSIGICYVGGLDAATWEPKDTRTDAQRWALRTLVGVLLAQYPDATVHGHREFAAKACPCFDVQAESWAAPPVIPSPTIAMAEPRAIIVPKHIRHLGDIKEDDIRAEVSRTGRSPEEVAVAFLERVADFGERALGPVSRILRLVQIIRG